jgi:5'-nucleotidase
MRILITNDDGIHAAGLEACEKIARALSDEVWIVAPETDQSGVSHSLSLNDPLRLRQVGERHFAVKGTPTDCVIMGVRHVMKDAPDLIISGVNRGRNCAEDVTYSGTVAGAMEGTVLGVPSFALSQAYAFTSRQKPFWETGIAHAPDLIRRILKTGMPRDVLVNINFPDCAPATSPSRCRASAIRICCASTRATTGAAIRITGSPSAAAVLPARLPAAISPRSTT